MENTIKNLKNMPIAVIPTFVGLSTLANAYLVLGFTWIRHLTMYLSIIVVVAYLLKIFIYPQVVKKEYSNTVPASLYAGITMLIMIIGSYLFTYNQVIGKALWSMGLFVHAIHIIVFTYRNVIKNFNFDTFVPSWFVTYNGIMVSTVVGQPMNEPLIGKFIVYYGIVILSIIMPFMIYRLIKYPIKDAMYHTQAIVLAPSSLCLVSYFNFIETPNTAVVYGLYTVVLLSLIFVIYRLPKFFKFKFNPGFAGLTFPMAIGIIASIKMSNFLANQGKTLSIFTNELAGIQLYITTSIILFVVFNFAKMLVSTFENKKVEVVLN